MMALHLGLSAVIGLVYWYHIRRLSRPKWLPPRFWLALVGAPLLLAAIIVPLVCCRRSIPCACRDR